MLVRATSESLYPDRERTNHHNGVYENDTPHLSHIQLHFFLFDLAVALAFLRSFSNFCKSLTEDRIPCIYTTGATVYNFLSSSSAARPSSAS